MSTSARFSTAGSLPAGQTDRLFTHEELARDFARLAGEGLLGHAYCFFGDDGVGKFRFAEAFAHFLERGAWMSVAGAPLADGLIVSRGVGQIRPNARLNSSVGQGDSAERASMGIDAVRAVRAFLAVTPLHSARRTVIIRDAEDLTWEAESALLKIVEEPPAHALIIITARSVEALFPPLASRMAKIYFPRLAQEKLAEILARDHGVSLKEAAAIAKRSFGRIGYALKLAKIKEKEVRSKTEKEAALTEKLESLILARWERGAEKESKALSFLLTRLEAASRFNLNPRLQEKAIAYQIGNSK